MRQKINVRVIAAASLLLAAQSQALNIFEDQYGHKMDLYGEIGTGGHFGADYEYGEFYTDETFVDDTFSSLGIKGTYDNIYYKLEMDYQRENWKGGSGDMVLAVDKSFFGYRITPKHSLEFGLTDTAFDAYDKYGDFTFDTTVETGEAGDQSSTLKYDGQLGYIKFGSSYSYRGKSESGSELGNIYNGYIGFFHDIFSVVVGTERRVGSDGLSKYGKQELTGLGMRLNVTEALSFGVNGYQEEEYISQEKQPIDLSDVENSEYRYNQYEPLDRSGWLISSKYVFNEKWEVVASHNNEEHEEWDDKGSVFIDQPSWGAVRNWQTFGVNFRPHRSVIFSAEVNTGEAAQDLYAYTRIYF